MVDYKAKQNQMFSTAKSLLDNSDNENAYKVLLGSDSLAFKGNWESPWRTIIAGSLADIVESTLVTDLAEPSKLDDTSWIKPGIASWIYWAYNHGSQDLQLVKKYIDLAAEMKWPYSLIDAEWDLMGNGGDVYDALAYAHEKGVKPMLWYNCSIGWINGAPTPKFRLNEREDRLKEYQMLKDNGVTGIKIDFFPDDKASTITISTFSRMPFLTILPLPSMVRLSLAAGRGHILT